VVYQVLIINFKYWSVKTVLLSSVFLFQRTLSFFVPKKCNADRGLNPIKIFVQLLYKMFSQIPGWELCGVCPCYSKEFGAKDL